MTLLAEQSASWRVRAHLQLLHALVVCPGPDLLLRFLPNQRHIKH